MHITQRSTKTDAEDVFATLMTAIAYVSFVYRSVDQRMYWLQVYVLGGDGVCPSQWILTDWTVETLVVSFGEGAECLVWQTIGSMKHFFKHHWPYETKNALYVTFCENLVLSSACSRWVTKKTEKTGRKCSRYGLLYVTVDFLLSSKDAITIVPIGESQITDH